jgi:hypothetical protein
LVSVSTVAQGKLKIDPENRYLLLSTVKTSTMQKELDEASGQGFRIIAAHPVVVSLRWYSYLERVTQPPDAYKYRTAGNFAHEYNGDGAQSGAQEGFRLLPPYDHR